jgi:hypothetical protein
MKITKTQLRQIIKEEVSKVLGTINENIGIDEEELLAMADKIYMRTGSMAYHTGQPHGQVLADELTKELKDRGLEHSDIQKAFKYLENQKENDSVRRALTKELSGLR